jgi:hypothetical protein
MIKEADVVVFFLERPDLARDEAIELVEIGDEIGRQCKIHGAVPSLCYCCSFQSGLSNSRR